MLGINYQYIYCKVTKCKFNEKHIIRDGKTNKPVEIWYTCEKEEITIDRSGKCQNKCLKNQSM